MIVSIIIPYHPWLPLCALFCSAVPLVHISSFSILRCLHLPKHPHTHSTQRNVCLRLHANITYNLIFMFSLPLIIMHYIRNGKYKIFILLHVMLYSTWMFVITRDCLQILCKFSKKKSKKKKTKEEKHKKMKTTERWKTERRKNKSCDNDEWM